MSRCDVVTEALVMGEPLSAADQAHADECEACRRLAGLPGLIAASSRPAPPRPGFSARMMAAARERMAQRRRRRVATFTFALAAAGASAVAVDRTLIRTQVEGSRAPAALTGSTVPTPNTADLDQDVDPLQQLESLRTMRHVVDWNDIEQPFDQTRTRLRQGGLP
jgi:hypothetical protein